MAQLKEYKTLKEKEEFFFHDMNQIDVWDIDILFDYLDREQKRSCVFRGCSEAKFKMYNSAQRFYINHELYRQVSKDNQITHYKKFIESLIEECKFWNKGTVAKLFKSNNISDNDSLGYLSYMQHYGIPSPLLDFTSNPYNALFFALNDIRFHNSDNEIDNYFSIYLCYNDATIVKRIRAIFNKLTAEYHNTGIPYNEVFRNVLHIILPEDKVYKIVNNVNIINQEGLFFYFSDPFIPLEELYKNVFSRYQLVAGFSKELEEQSNKFGKCLNIHKSLVPAIKKRLEKEEITKNFLFPDIYVMKESIIDKATINVLTTRKDIQ